MQLANPGAAAYRQSGHFFAPDEGERLTAIGVYSIEAAFTAILSSSRSTAHRATDLFAAVMAADICRCEESLR